MLGVVGWGVAAGVCSVVNIAGDISMPGCVPVDGWGTDGVPGGSVADVCCSSAAGPGVGFMFCRTMSSFVDCSGVLLNKDRGGTRLDLGCLGI